MEHQKNQNGMGSREWYSILVQYILCGKTILGFHWYYGTSWRSGPWSMNEILSDLRFNPYFLDKDKSAITYIDEI